MTTIYVATASERLGQAATHAYRVKPRSST
jgi:hypothetical protein